MSDAEATTTGVSSLDRAHAARWRTAGRRASLISFDLTASSSDLGAGWLVARLLTDAGRADAAGQAALELVERFTRRGDLSSAVLAAHLAVQAGQAADPLLRQVAEAFGRGSPRVSAEASPVPPALPVAVGVAPFFAKLSGAALLEAADGRRSSERSRARTHCLPTRSCRGCRCSVSSRRRRCTSC